MPDAEAGFRALYEQLSHINRSLGALEEAGKDRLRGQQDLAKHVGEILNEVNAVQAELYQHRRTVSETLGQLASDINKPTPETERLSRVLAAIEKRIQRIEDAEEVRARDRVVTRRQLYAIKAGAALAGGAAVTAAAEAALDFIKRKLGF